MLSQSKFIIVAGRQRSGTTVFRKFLETSPELTDIGEIFHSRLSKSRARYYSYYLRRIQETPALLPAGNDHTIFSDFIEQLKTVRPKKRKILDVKYNAWDVVRYYDHEGRFPSFLPKFVHEHKIPVIHMVRRNKLRLILSRELAQLTNQWSAKTPESLKTPTKKVALPAKSLVAAIEQEIRESERFDRMIHELGCPGLKLYYEELFDADGNFSEAVETSCRDLLGDTFRPNRIPQLLKQNNRTIAETISNEAKVREALAPTGHAWMLD